MKRFAAALALLLALLMTAGCGGRPAADRPGPELSTEAEAEPEAESETQPETEPETRPVPTEPRME